MKSKQKFPFLAVAAVFLLAQALFTPPSLAATSTSTQTSATTPTFSNIRAENITSASAYIKWDTNIVTNSVVQYGTSTAAITNLVTQRCDGGTDSTYHCVYLSGLSPATFYYYFPRADTSTASYNGPLNQFYTLTAAASGTTASSTPPVPSGLSATYASSAVVLNWQDTSSLETQFKIYKRQSSGYTSWFLLTSLPANTSAYTDTALGSSSYDYYVVACSSYGCSGQSNTVTVAIPATINTATTTAPSAPSNLTAAVLGQTVALSWQDNSGNETNFKLYKTISGLWTDIGNVSANTTSFTDQNVTAGQSYSYKVQAFVQTSGSTPLYSAVSNMASVTLPALTSSSTTATITPPTLATATQASQLTKKISGVAKYSSGEPVTDGEVGAYNTGSGAWYSARIGSSGAYSLYVSAGSYTVGLKSVQPALADWSFSGKFESVNFASDNTPQSATLNFSVTRSSSVLKVVAVNEQNEPLGQVFVSVEGSSQRGGGQKTDSSGQASFTLQPDSYIVQAFADPALGYINPAKQYGNLEASQTKELRFMFVKAKTASALTISGVTTMGDQAVAEAFVWAYSEDGRSLSLRSDSEGKFSFAAPASSIWHIGAAKETAEGSYKAEQREVEVGQASVSLTLQLAKVAAPIPASTSSGSGSQELKTTATDGAAVVVPANAAGSGSLTVTLKPTVEAPSQPAKIPISTIYDISVTNQSGASVTSFSSELTITIPYSQESLAAAGIRETEARVSYYDETSGAWVPVDNFVVDTARKEIVLKVSHLTRFAIVAPADTTPPAAPASPKAKRTKADDILLTWKNPVKDFKYAKIYRSTTAKALGKLLLSNISEEQFTDQTVGAGITFYYTIRSLDPAGNESTNANQVSAKSVKQLAKATTLGFAMSRDLKYGMAGVDVKVLQILLAEKGFLKRTKFTTVFDTATKNAVKALQNQYSAELLPKKGQKATGTVSGATKAKINELLAP